MSVKIDPLLRLSFISLITEGDDSQNIRVFDGDVIQVTRSKEILTDQVIKARNTNLWISGSGMRLGIVTTSEMEFSDDF